MQVVEVVTTPSDGDDVPLAALSRFFLSKSKKMEDSFKLSQEGRPNRIAASIRDDGRWVFTEGMLQRLLWAWLFPTRTKRIASSFVTRFAGSMSMRSGGIFEIKQHCQSWGHLRRDQRYRERFSPDL